jgi:uncharacterized protein YbdZ (MbtH family)
MPWLNFDFLGSAGVQVPDTEIAVIEETNASQINIPQNIRLTDMILNITALDDHQYSIWTSGRKQSSNVSASQLNPASQGRFSIRGQNIVIPSGTSIQMRGAQITIAALAPEPTKVLLEYVAA